MLIRLLANVKLEPIKEIQEFLNSLELLREMMNQSMFEEMTFQDTYELENESDLSKPILVINYQIKDDIITIEYENSQQS